MSMYEAEDPKMYDTPCLIKIILIIVAIKIDKMKVLINLNSN